MRSFAVVIIVIALLASIAVGIWNGTARELDVEITSHATERTNSQDGETLTSLDSPQNAGDQQVAVRISILSFTSNSRKAQDILMDYQKRFDAALGEFNATCSLDSEEFLRSRECEALIKEFCSRGKFTFHDELRQVIPIGQDHEWGDSNSISAKRSELDGHLSVTFAVTYGQSSQSSTIGQSSASSTIVVSSNQTIVAGGLSTCNTQSAATAIPVLADLPIVGAKLFTIPYTRTTGVDERLLVSASLIK